MSTGHWRWVIKVALFVLDQTLDNFVAGLVLVFVTKHARQNTTRSVWLTEHRESGRCRRSVLCRAFKAAVAARAETDDPLPLMAAPQRIDTFKVIEVSQLPEPGISEPNSGAMSELVVALCRGTRIVTSAASIGSLLLSPTHSIRSWMSTTVAREGYPRGEMTNRRRKTSSREPGFAGILFASKPTWSITPSGCSSTSAFFVVLF
jgi:hypothetical protein